jgi:hypothetical protein
VGEWNFQEIEVQGQRIKVTLNGTKILDADISTFDRSQIAHPPKGLDRTKRPHRLRRPQRSGRLPQLQGEEDVSFTDIHPNSGDGRKSIAFVFQ